MLRACSRVLATSYASCNAQQVVYNGAEGFFNAQGHVRRESGLAVEQVRQRRAANFEKFGRILYGQAQFLDDRGSDEVARIGAGFSSAS